jgi:elongation factor G
MAFQSAAEAVMREFFTKTRPALLEPIMHVEIECPEQFQGAIVANLSSRRGMITATEAIGPVTRINGEIPLAETFGYSTDLRSLSQGQATFSMEFSGYKALPSALAEEVIAQRKKELAAC